MSVLPRSCRCYHIQFQSAPVMAEANAQKKPPATTTTHGRIFGIDLKPTQPKPRKITKTSPILSGQLISSPDEVEIGKSEIDGLETVTSVVDKSMTDNGVVGVVVAVDDARPVVQPEPTTQLVTPTSKGSDESAMSNGSFHTANEMPVESSGTSENESLSSADKLSKTSKVALKIQDESQTNESALKLEENSTGSNQKKVTSKPPRKMKSAKAIGKGKSEVKCQSAVKEDGRSTPVSPRSSTSGTADNSIGDADTAYVCTEQATQIEMPMRVSPAAASEQNQLRRTTPPDQMLCVTPTSDIRALIARIVQRQKDDEQNPEMDLPVATDGLFSLPPELLQRVFGRYFMFEQLAKLRLTSKAFDRHCGLALNRGFYKVLHRTRALLARCKLRMPKRESEQKDHPLYERMKLLQLQHSHMEWLEGVFSTYIDVGVTCFIPGRILDDNVWRLGHITETLNTTVTGEEEPFPLNVFISETEVIRDFAKMAVDYFENDVAPHLDRFIANSPELRARRQRAYLKNRIGGTTQFIDGREVGGEQQQKSRERKANSPDFESNRYANALQQQIAALNRKFDKEFVEVRREMNALRKELVEVRIENGELRRAQQDVDLVLAAASRLSHRSADVRRDTSTFVSADEQLRDDVFALLDDLVEATVAASNDGSTQSEPQGQT